MTNLYLNGAIFNGSLADFTSYSDIQCNINYSLVGNNSLTNKNYVDTAIAALASRITVLENA